MSRVQEAARERARSGPMHALRVLREGEGLIKLARSAKDYARAFRNPLRVALHVGLGLFPVTVSPRERDIAVCCYDVDQLYLASKGFSFEFRPDASVLEFVHRGRPLKFAVPPYGDFLGVFGRQDYSSLDVVGKTVIDVGANVGDSSVYFAISGAKRVVAIEPNFAPEARTNAQLNHLSNIEVREAIISGSNLGQARVSRHRTNLDSQVRFASEGELVDIVTLDGLSRDLEGEQSILKMDCEGCEYAAILDSSNIALRRFAQMAIEYHHGALPIVQKLEAAGFSVRATGPHQVLNYSFENPRLSTGMIFADREPCELEGD